MTVSLYSQKQDPIALVFVADDNHAVLLAVAIHSALVHLNDSVPLHLYIIDGGIHESNRERLYRVLDSHKLKLNLQWVTPDTSMLDGLKTFGHHMTTTVFFDLLIPEVVSEKFEKAIYLDCDTQVEANLRELWKEDISNNALLAVQDFVIPYVSSPGGLLNYKEFGYSENTPYFNAGVLVFNLNRWREEKISQKVINCLRQSEPFRRQIHQKYGLRLNDQYGLNSILARDWRKLNPKWNVMSTLLERKTWEVKDLKDDIRSIKNELLNNPFIYHFTGPKPRKLSCEHPAKIRWRRYLEESQWFSEKESLPADTYFSLPEKNLLETPKMVENKVTIVIPTFNRSTFLKICIENALRQNFEDFQIIILDNASSDKTSEIVESFIDSRITYLRNERNIGLFGNWNKALEVSSSSYVCILSDDDLLLPGFIQKSVTALESYPNVAFTAGLARYIDTEGKQLHLQDRSNRFNGIVEGLDFLEQVVSPSPHIIHSSTVVMRSSAVKAVNNFEIPHSKQLLDLNLYIRLAAQFDLYFFNQEIAQVRLHPRQIKEQEFEILEGTQPFSMLAERTDAIGYLLQSERATNTSYLKWLSKRLLTFNKQRGDLMRVLVPSLNFAWSEKLEIAKKEILKLVSSTKKFILIDENIFSISDFPNHNVLPFLERDGVYWGDPPDDTTAISEIERMRCEGATYIFFSWPAFWWFDYYSSFYEYLRSTFVCVIQNDLIIGFELMAITQS